MNDSEGEIEYLDEDAEIVQQCVQSSPSQPMPVSTPQYFHPRPSLMVERPVPQKRKKIEDDSEYEPSDEPPPSPPSPPPAKKRPGKPLKQPRLNVSCNYLKIAKKANLHQPTVQELYLKRKKCKIHIPDYDDPLCLPVRAIKADTSDKKRLTNWNNACLEHFKHCDNLLKPEQGRIKRSLRTAVFKNIVNKQSGQTETTICSKVCVENEDLDKKSEIFQCVLPRYREKKVLPSYTLTAYQQPGTKRTVTEIILSKEDHKEGEALVVYQPQDSVSAVYALIDKRMKDGEEEKSSPCEEDSKLFLKELTACRMCSSCFQTSWRGVTNMKKKSVGCPVCGRACITAYNLLSHFKTHSAQDVARYRKIISAALADLVIYHYKCRMCRRKFDSIRALRAHVKEHQGKEKFTCNICNREVD